MKKVKFTVGTRYVGSDYSEVIEVNDDTTTEEIEEMYKEWVWQNIDGYWEYED